MLSLEKAGLFPLEKVPSFPLIGRLKHVPDAHGSTNGKQRPIWSTIASIKGLDEGRIYVWRETCTARNLARLSASDFRPPQSGYCMVNYVIDVLERAARYVTELTGMCR